MNAPNHSLTVVDLPTDRLIEYGRNPRKNDAVVDKMVASIKEFGFSIPILATPDDVVVDGHLRLKAARKLNLPTVPVIVADGWTDAQVKAFRLLANRSVAWAEWDDELLRVELEELQGFDFDLKMTGFDTEELEHLLEKSLVGDGDEAGDTEPQTDRMEELLEKWDVRRGDIWIAGEHRIMCGDSTSSDDVGRLLGSDVPVMMVTDPPYGVSYDAAWRTKMSTCDRAIGKVANDDRADWREAWALFPGDVAYVWHGVLTSHVVAESLIASDFQIRTEIVWAKNHLVVGRGDYHSQHESCWYCVRKGKSGLRTDDRKQTTLWQIDKQNKSETGHSTQKPLECMERPIRNHKIETVYDPFLGSGTTLIAAYNQKRRCWAMEIEPAYVAVAMQRFLDHTGIQPERAT